MSTSQTLSLTYVLAAIIALMLRWLRGDPNGIMLNCLFILGAISFLIQTIRRPSPKRALRIAARALSGTVIVIAINNLVSTESSYSLLAIATMGMYLTTHT